MCIGSTELLADVWEDGGTRAGRLSDGRVVSLAFLPEARSGDVVLLHLGIPVEVISPTRTDPEGVTA
jgi:hydrogenase maturation factor